MALLELNGVDAFYARIQALRGISLTLDRGEIVALIGSNGAGKTTTLRILAGLLEPTSGHASIDGVDVEKQPDQVHSRIGYMPDFFGVYDQLSVTEYLDFYAACYRQPKERRTQIVGELLALDLLHAFLAAEFSTSEEFRRRVAKLGELEQSHS